MTIYLIVTIYYVITYPKASLDFIGKKIFIILEVKFHFDENKTQ